MKLLVVSEPVSKAFNLIELLERFTFITLLRKVYDKLQLSIANVRQKKDLMRI